MVKLTRSLVFSRRLPARFGGARLQVSPAASLAYLRSLDRPNWQDLYEFASRHVQPGNVVWDVGANLGVFSFAAAHVAGSRGSVLAVEADPWLSTLIRRSTLQSRPEAAPVESLCVAISKQCGLQSFETPEWTRSGSHLSSSTGASEKLVGKSVESHPTITVSLDWLCEQRPPPDVLKIDIEGSELDALQGAEILLSQHRPKILLEVYERSADEIAALFHRHRYDLYDAEDGWNLARKITRPAYQTLALPR
ncbi:FkbM family methyltransferase [Oleiharenicola lentus]|uniref:FkbM family methyltransferase n=1 Tax=Oleiharenicola lentus TaxID=2508720 RepID=UPI003F67DC3D